MKNLPGYIFLVFIVLSCQEQPKKIKIAVGSCSREYAENQLWDEINSVNPDWFIWTGDNIYGDTDDMLVLREKYDKQKSHPGYQELMKNSRIVGTWDDHDYGINDGGSEYSMKDESKAEFIRFLDIEDNNPIHDHAGVYQSYDLSSGRNSIKIILLDTRYFRDPLIPDTITDARYTANPEGDILGSEQWAWLQSQLESSESDYNLIISSIQYIANDHGYEKWGNFPLASEKMKSLLTRYPDKKVIFISGDRHISEISRMNIPELKYPLYDFTCSGLTHSWGDAPDEPNQYREGPLIKTPNFGLLEFNFEKDEINISVIGAENNLLHQALLTYN